MQSFYIKTKIIIERDLSEAVLGILKDEASRAVLVFVDEHVQNHPAVKNLMNKIMESERKSELRPLPSGEPTTALVNEHTQMYKDWGCDMLIAIGGGSVIDFVKALSGMLIYKDKVEKYQVNSIPYMEAVKKIAVSTTAGTGAEISKVGVLINKEINFKRGVVGPGVSPDYAIVCAELSTSVPLKVTAACGMDAMAHAMEAYVSKIATEISKMYSKEAFVRLYHNLPLVTEDLDNLNLREEMLLGSALAGGAINNANTGACHGMSYAPGVYFGVPHAVAISVFFVESILLNIEKGCTRGYAELYEAIGFSRSGDDHKDALAFVEVMRAYPPLVKYCGSLFDYGITGKDMAFLAEKAMGNTAAFVTNPVDISPEDGVRIYRKALNMD